MGRRAGAGLAAVAAMVLGLAACEPPVHPMEIQVTLHRDGLISRADAQGRRTLVLTGVSQCTRSEPVDLFPTIQQGSVEDRPGELSVPCGPSRQEWSASFTVDGALGPGLARVDVEVCTNPAEAIDEDCASAGRVVGFVKVS